MSDKYQVGIEVDWDGTAGSFEITEIQNIKTLKMVDKNKWDTIAVVDSKGDIQAFRNTVFEFSASAKTLKSYNLVGFQIVSEGIHPSKTYGKTATWQSVGSTYLKVRQAVEHKILELQNYYSVSGDTWDFSLVWEQLSTGELSTLDPTLRNAGGPINPPRAEPSPIAEEPSSPLTRLARLFRVFFKTDS